MRYHFNFRDRHRFFEDIEGQEFATLEAAVEDGRLSARELLALDHGHPDPTYRGARFEITDSDGLVRAVISFRETALRPTVR
jgi:hypothetical protein